MIRTVGVVVPAVNEQATIGACLDSLEAARSRLRSTARRDVDVRIVVVLDSCVDETAALVRQHRGVESIACSAGRAATARKAGAQWLMTDTAVSSRELWLANTDADSTVPADWITTQVDESDHGAHLVLGTVLPQPGLAPVVERAWSEHHRLNEGHPHVHGANLGIRADVFAALGGWPDLASGEDVALAGRAASAGHVRITRTARIPVRTSVRMVGRAPNGFAAYLRGLSTAPEELAV